MRPEMRGCPRPYLQAVEESVIDVRIRGLVDALNIDGVCSTWASCEGHGRIRCHKSPYVLLDTSVDFAGALSLMLEQEAVHEHSRLGHSWNISGVFMRGDLRFRMAPEQDLLGLWPFVRMRLTRDFKTLTELVQVVTQRWQLDPTCFKKEPEHQHDKGGHQHSKKLPPLAGSTEAKRIGTPTIGTYFCAGTELSFAV